LHFPLTTHPNLGIFTTDADLIIRSWDDWLEHFTKIAKVDAIGKHVEQVIPDWTARHLDAFFTRSLREGVIEILAPRFHHYLIPCQPSLPSRRFQQMQQKVTIAPLQADAVTMGLIVTIEDMTDLEDRDQDDTLVEGFDNENWALRRAAADRMAAQGSDTAISNLLRVLREEHRNLNVLNSALRVLTASGLDTTSPLVELLRDSDPEVRMYAALALGDQKNKVAVPALIKVLTDQDENVRYHVIEALAKIRAPEAANELLAIAQSGDFFLAFPAIDALGRLNSPHIAIRLVPLLEDDMIRSAVVEALGNMGDESVVPRLVQLLDRKGVPVGIVAQALTRLFDRYETQLHEGNHISDLIRHHAPPGAARNVIDALGEADAEPLRSLVRLLSWLESDDIGQALANLLGTERVRKEVVEALVRHGKSVMSAVIPKLASDDLEVRRAAILALGRIGDARCVPELVRILRDDRELGTWAANALAKIGDPRAYDALIELLREDNAAVRQAAIGALNSLGDVRTEGDVLRLMSDPNAHVREAAVRICGYFGYSDCASSLFERVDDTDESVRRAAIESLPYLDLPGIPEKLLTLLRDHSPRVRATAAQALASTDLPRVATDLITALGDPDPWVRYYAARSLGQLRTPDAAQSLARLLKSDTATHVRIASAEALAEIGGPTAAKALSAALQSEDRDLFSVVVKSLALLGNPDALPPLLEMLHSHDRNRKLDAIRALGTRTDHEVIRALEWVAASDKDTEVATSSLQQLASMRSNDAVTSVVRLTAQPSLREIAISELAKVDNAYLETIASGLSHPQSEVREAVVAALSRKKHPRASELLALALDDEQTSVRLAAISALARLGSHTAERKLALVAATDSDLAVRMAAQKALGN
jgi:HEAT repeat protein